MPTPDTIVIGGGAAGLSAAVRLSAAGRRVLLLERTQHLGGRTYSFPDETTGDTVDNGQHLLMGCYRETLAYLDLIGSRSLATLQRSLALPFANVATGGHSRLSAAWLPAPLHVFAGLLQLRTLPLADRLRLARVGVELLWTAPWKEYALKHMTVEEWLVGLGQSETARRHLWDVIAVGSLNEAPSRVAALPFFRVLRAAFLGRRRNASLLIPNTGLSELLVDPARAFIERRHGTVRTGNAAKGFTRTKGGAISGVVTSQGTVAAKSVVLAVPHHAVPSLLPGLKVTANARRLSASPIITVNLWFDRPVMDEPMTALLNGRMQWAFNRTQMLDGTSERQCIACVISGAGREADIAKKELVRWAVEDLSSVFPKTRTARVIHSLVIKEMRATFTPRPGTEDLRPGPVTEIPGLWLAGDWTNTGLPATIEGAVLSGRRAAEAILQAP